MRSIKITLIIILIILVTAITGCSERARDMEQVSENERIIIRFSHVVAENTPKGLAAKRFARLIQERTNGRVEVQVYPNSNLYKDGEELKALLENNVQMIAPATAKLTTMFPQWQVFDLPFLFNDYKDVHSAMDGVVGEELFKVLEERNILGLAMWDNGFKQMSATHPLENIEDFRGLSFRIMPSKVLENQFSRLGAYTKVLPFNEVYRALQVGEVDGAENPLSNFFTKKFHQVQPYLTISNHGYVGYAVLTNKTFWDSIPEGIQTIIQETMKEVTEWERAEAERQNVMVLSDLQKMNITKIHYLKPQEKMRWREILKPVYADFTDQIGQNILNGIEN